jgi:hypothetical protein
MRREPAEGQGPTTYHTTRNKGWSATHCLLAVSLGSGRGAMRPELHAIIGDESSTRRLQTRRANTPSLTRWQRTDTLPPLLQAIPPSSLEVSGELASQHIRDSGCANGCLWGPPSRTRQSCMLTKATNNSDVWRWPTSAPPTDAAGAPRSRQPSACLSPHLRNPLHQIRIRWSLLCPCRRLREAPRRRIQAPEAPPPCRLPGAQSVSWHDNSLAPAATWHQRSLQRTPAWHLELHRYAFHSECSLSKIGEVRTIKMGGRKSERDERV